MDISDLIVLFTSLPVGSSSTFLFSAMPCRTINPAPAHLRLANALPVKSMEMLTPRCQAIVRQIRATFLVAKISGAKDAVATPVDVSGVHPAKVNNLSKSRVT